MDEPEEQHTPEVSTEPQRKALEEMSRHLVDSLNDMVREQEERAERFARTQHSLSPLPGLPEAEPTVAPLAATPEPPPAVRRKKAPPPPLVIKRPEPSPRSKEAPAPTPHPYKPERKPQPRSEGAEESGCGSGPLITLIVILIIIVRSCT